MCTVCTSIYTHRDALGPFFILLRPVYFVTQVQPAAGSLIPLLGACSAVVVNLAPVFLIVEGRVPCWTPPAPQAVKTLLTFSFVLYRPHLREAFDSSGDKRFSHVSGHSFPPRTPCQLSSMPTLGSLCAAGEFRGNIPPVPFGRSLASVLGESQVWLGHSYPFPRSSVVFSCTPACRMFPPQCWPTVSPEPRAKDRGAVDTQAGMLITVPLLWLFEFALLRVDRARVF